MTLTTAPQRSEYVIEKKNVCPSVRGAETTGSILILKSGGRVDPSGDGVEDILFSLTLTTRLLEPENTEKSVLLENLSIDFDEILI